MIAVESCFDAIFRERLAPAILPSMRSGFRLGGRCALKGHVQAFLQQLAPYAKLSLQIGS